MKCFRWFVRGKVEARVIAGLLSVVINCLLLVGCSGQVVDLTPVHVESAGDRAGEAVAENLTRRYSDKRANCGSTTSPAFLCTGVMLRVTKTSNNYDPWDHSEFSSTTDAVSFSYLRDDSNFFATPWRGANGFIFFPVLATPTDKYKLEVKCYFPLDGATFYRNAAGQFGCRDSIVTYPFPEVSKPCREQGIVTAEQWLEHFQNPDGKRRPNAYSCSFMVTSNLNAEAVRAFNEAIRVRAALISQTAFGEHNEFRIKAWPESDPKKIPIEAFFYVKGGVENAKIDQRKYFDRTGGVVVPIIHITLPDVYTGKATFEYLTSDQAVLPPLPDPDKIKPSVPKAYDAAGEHIRISDIYKDEGLDVEIPHYPDMAADHRLTVRWNGRVSYNSSSDEVGAPPGKRIVKVPRLEVMDNIGSTVEISYAVRETPGGVSLESERLTLHIDPQALNLPAPTIAGNSVSVRVVGPVGYQVRVRWSGSITRDTAWQNVDSNAGNVFLIPQGWFDENRGREVLINYSVGRTNGSEQMMFSHVLRLAVP
ncbi:hypothetical protein MO767_20110 [Pseudomonas sp. UYIF39]|uniref:hypothetical protein n=1 Tax=Pseudomonas sp. UYIF39 TaxID=1630747 RepID=UPI00249ED9C8|nr:hypothetical protein [Pseudomonas sp. UYIF39]MDI3356632.1 hypothetical protein [Pseudomonas sp. UYIF39]